MSRLIEFRLRMKVDEEDEQIAEMLGALVDLSVEEIGVDKDDIYETGWFVIEGEEDKEGDELPPDFDYYH